MVEHHVQIDLHSLPVAGQDQLLQLRALPVELRLGGVAGVGGEKAHRAVAPVVVELLPVHLPVVLHFVELENGHQLDGVDPQALEVGQLLHEPREGARMLDTGGGVPGEAPYVELVDDEVLHGNQRRRQVPPVEVVPDHPGLVVLAPGGGVAPPALAGDGLGVRVQEVLALVEDLSLFRLIGAVHPVGVLEFLDIQLKDDHGIHIADPVPLGEGQHGEGFDGLPVEQQQLDGAGPVGMDREIHPARDGGSPVALIEAGAHGEAVDIVQGGQVDGPGQVQLFHQQLAGAVPGLEVVLFGCHRVVPPVLMDMGKDQRHAQQHPQHGG